MRKTPLPQPVRPGVAELAVTFVQVPATQVRPGADGLREKLDRSGQVGKRLQRTEEPFVCRNHMRVEA